MKVIKRIVFAAVCTALLCSAFAFEEDYNIDMMMGETHQIEEMGVRYVSHEPRIVTVSQKGKIKAVGFGQTVVEVLGKDGEKLLIGVESLLPSNVVLTSKDQYQKAVINGALALNETFEFKQRVSGLPNSNNPQAKKQALQKFFSIESGEISMPFLGGIEFTYSYYDIEEYVTADVQIKYLYRSSAEVMRAIQQDEPPQSKKARVVYDKVYEIIDELGLTKQTPRKQAAKLVHDYLILNAQYDSQAARYESAHPDSYEAYGVLINKTGVCQSYAEAYLLILGALDIPVTYAVGTANQVPHSWNRVLFEDGRWHNVDITFDDPLPDRPGEVQSDFFDISDEDLKQTHKW